MPDWPNLDHWLPPIGPPPERHPAPPYSLRHPEDADFAVLDRRLRAWSEGRADLPGPWRTWIRDFGVTGWLAEAEGSPRPLGILVGFLSPARPGRAVVERIVVDPAFRRRGIGRALVERFDAQVAAMDATAVDAACRPDDHIALRFFGSLRFVPDETSGTRLYGVPAHSDWDGEGEDRVLLVRSLQR